MSLVVEAYQDPIIALATDPNLNKEKHKIDHLVAVIHGFPPTERRVSKLCQLALAILQTLEKIELNLKNWAFMSLDINSPDHFHNSSADIKDFNNSISVKVLTACTELNKKLAKISYDLDYITKAQKTLSPIEFISDSGTLLTSLSLRNIKLKHELTDRVTVAYAKARLITIGTELEQMMEDDDSATVSTYKSFVATLLRQLNTSIEDEDLESKHECLAVINDMDKMFDAFKLERMRTRASADSQSDDDSVDDQLDVVAQAVDYDSDNLSNSLHTSVYGPPMIHSITKPHHQHHTELTRSESFGSMNDSTLLHKTTLSEEMPFLMSAFKAARNIEEDIKTYQEEEDKETRASHKRKPSVPAPLSSASSESSLHHIFPNHKSNLPDTPLTSQSTILEQPHHSPYSYLHANHSLLSRLGIKPQVVAAPRELAVNTTNNINNYHQAPKAQAANEKDKENVQSPLTTKNLHVHNLSSLSVVPSNEFDDHVE